VIPFSSLIYEFNFVRFVKAGLYIQNLVDSYVSGYPVFICAALEAIGLGWIYGIKRLSNDFRSMLGFEISCLWKFMFVALTPVFSTVNVNL
jgi:SNF family Na+-dependent transporter